MEAASGHAMSQGLLSVKETIHIRLGPNKEIASACAPVFEQEHQEEARMVIYEADYLKDYLDEFSSLLMTGSPEFVSITEAGRQSSYRYAKNGETVILLTRAHQGVSQILNDLN